MMKLKYIVFLFVGILVSCTGARKEDTKYPVDVTIYAVGDVAECGDKPASEALANRTAAIIRKTKGPILLLGDIAYPKGREEDFSNCFVPTWGEFKPRIFPSPGNHEYLTTDAAPYYAYFGSAAGQIGKGFYSTNIGAWHVIALNSNIDTHIGSEQERWLRADLAASKTKCTLAFWHHPVFSSSPRGVNFKMLDIWQTLYENGVDLVLNGHEHEYERFAPQTPVGALDNERGVRQITVGTGGASSSKFVTPLPNSEVRETKLLGVMELTLRQDSYAWKFIPAEGYAFQESGEARCHD